MDDHNDLLPSDVAVPTSTRLVVRPKTMTSQVIPLVHPTRPGVQCQVEVRYPDPIKVEPGGDLLFQISDLCRGGRGVELEQEVGDVERVESEFVQVGWVRSGYW